MTQKQKISDGQRFGLSVNARKVIAIVAMTIDHLAWMGIDEYAQAYSPGRIFLPILGRLTAPIMFYFAAEGYHHTRHFLRYLGGRMALLSVVAHFAFCFAFQPSDNPLKTRFSTRPASELYKGDLILGEVPVGFKKAFGGGRKLFCICRRRLFPGFTIQEGR